jgi:hypothetical protein
MFPDVLKLLPEQQKENSLTRDFSVLKGVKTLLGKKKQQVQHFVLYIKCFLKCITISVYF